MPITSTENTVGQYILYHHATTDRHCTVTYSHVSMDLTSNGSQQDEFPVTSPDADSVIFGVHNWMYGTCEEEFYTNEESSKNEGTAGVGDIRVLFPLREE